MPARLHPEMNYDTSPDESRRIHKSGDIEAIWERTVRLSFLADVELMLALCDAPAIDRLKSAATRMKSRDFVNFLNGYRLAIAAPLSSMMGFSILHADRLGPEPDDRLASWWTFRDGVRIESVIDALTDPGSDIGRLCSTFADLGRGLREANIWIERNGRCDRKVWRLCVAVQENVRWMRGRLARRRTSARRRRSSDPRAKGRAGTGLRRVRSNLQDRLRSGLGVVIANKIR